MRFLTSALISEGASDDRFLPRLLTRALEELCAGTFAEVVDVGDVTVLRSGSRPHSISEAVELVSANAGSFALVFFHRDQGASPQRVRQEWLSPLTEAWGSRSERLVPVVPIRETEAWMLADGDAMRAALGVNWSNAELGLPAQPRGVESIRDPKQRLRRIGARLPRQIDSYFERLGEEVSVGVLRQVPAFDQWWEDTTAALHKLWYTA